MEGNMYKELSYKMQRLRIVSWLIGAVVLLLCLLIGIGCYILVVGMNGKQLVTETPIKEEITIIEGSAQIRDPVMRRIEAAKNEIGQDVEPLAHLTNIDFPLPIDTSASEYGNEAEIHPNSYKTSFSMRYPQNNEEEAEEQQSLLNALASFIDTPEGKLIEVFNDRNTKKYVEQTLRVLDDFASQITTSEDSQGEGHHSRQKRSILGLGVLGLSQYFSYLGFGKFMYNQVSEIAEYRMESRSFQSRKLGGDSEADFLDGLFWPTKSQKTVKKSSAVRDQEVQENVAVPVQEIKKPWSPMVNQVPIHFVGEILRTLLNLMKEFLMKDHVMECLWYMFCQDVNHQAKYSDVYGILARVNR